MTEQVEKIPGAPEYMNKPACERTDLEFVDWVRNHMPIAVANPRRPWRNQQRGRERVR